MDNLIYGATGLAMFALIAWTTGVKGLAVMMATIGPVTLLSAHSHPEDEFILFGMGVLQIGAALILWKMMDIRDIFNEKQPPVGKTPGKADTKANDNTHR